jgi:tetratricopeptide (TPR) repeat protein
MTDLRKPSMKHNPGFLPADEIIDSFIVRQAELESLLETLRSNNTASNQHILVIGRRGMGKTMLVHRVALAIERDPDLASHWYPILFGEEAYNVGTAAELWLEALHQLARQTEDKRWHDAHVSLRRERDNRRLHDLALARLLDFADERKVRLMIAVENLQDILGAQMPEEEGWVLRHTLLNEPRIMLLATATTRFDDIDQPKKAAYELFGTLQLRPLDPDAIRAIWERLTGERLEGQAHRVIEIFTGGNPRLLTVLAGFAHGRTLREFMSDLLGLIDDHSDYFKSNLEALPLDERRAFVALCELWEPSPARMVGEVARFDVNKTSMLLGRLVHRGAAEIVQIKGRTKYYQTCERLYSIFHRLRRNTTRNNRAASVVEFIARFYLPERLPEFAIRIAAEACRETAEMREEHLLVLHLLFEQGNIPPETALEQFPQAFWTIPEIRRDDLHWRPRWEAQRIAQIHLWARDISKGINFLDVADVDAPLLQVCEQMATGAASAESCRAVFVEHFGHSSRAAVMFSAVQYCATFDIQEIEQLARDLHANTNIPPPVVDFMIGVGAGGRWENPQIKSLSEEKLMAVIASQDQTMAMAAAWHLFVLYEWFGDVDAAIRMCERALTVRSSVAVHRDLGRLLVDRDPVRAEAEFRLALDASPYEPRTGLLLIELLLSQNRVGEADAFARAWRTNRPFEIAALTAFCHASVRSGDELDDATLEEFFAEVVPSRFMNRPIDEWLVPCSLVGLWLEVSKAVPIATAIRDEIVQRTESFDEATIDAVASILAFSPHRAIVEMSTECDARLAHVRPRPRHVKYALVRGDHDLALDRLRELAHEDPEELGRFLGVHRDTLLQLAVARPEELHAIASNIPLFEPLAFALAQELGHDVLAPYEVTEVAKDIRAELRELRGPTYVVDVPSLAAAEDAPRRTQTKQPAKKKRRKPSKRRL